MSSKFFKKLIFSKDILFNLFKHSITFSMRRLQLQKKIKNKYNLIIIDMDGTITNTHTFKEALIGCYGKSGFDIYSELLLSSTSKKYSADNLRMLSALDLLIKGNFEKENEKKLFKLAKKELNEPLVQILKQLPVEKIVITRSSDYIAKRISGHLDFQGGYGSILDYSPKDVIIGAKLLVSDSIPEKTVVPFTTKEILAKQHMSMKGKRFELRNTIVIGNDSLDLNLMVNAGLTIASFEKKMDESAKLFKYFQLYDIALSNNFKLLQQLDFF